MSLLYNVPKTTNHKVQFLLNYLIGDQLTAPLVVDGVFGKKSKEALMLFQSQNKLVKDGIFGNASFNKIRQLAIEKLCGTLKLKTMPADYYDAQGTTKNTMRTDAAYFYEQLYNELHNYGAIITSAGALRGLSAPVTAGRSTVSMHYVGLAFDLHTGSGMMNPKKDPYVIVKDGSYWRVYARCTNNGNAKKITLNNPITYAKRKGDGTTVTDYFVDFTAIAAKYHFNRIEPHSQFFTGGNMIHAEWWHFQNDFLLISGYSTFGQELKSLYSLQQIINAKMNDSRLNRVYGKNWN